MAHDRTVLAQRTLAADVCWRGGEPPGNRITTRIRFPPLMVGKTRQLIRGDVRDRLLWDFRRFPDVVIPGGFTLWKG